MNPEEKQKQIQHLRHTLAESKLAIDGLRKVIAEVEARLQQMETPRNFEAKHKSEGVAA